MGSRFLRLKRPTMKIRRMDSSSTTLLSLSTFSLILFGILIVWLATILVVLLWFVRHPRPQVRVRVRRLVTSARLPEYHYPDDSGADLSAVLDDVLAIGHLETKVVSFGIAVDLPRGYEAQVRPRSTLSGRGIFVSLGTVDRGFGGELSATIVNASGKEVFISPGDRVAQLVIAPAVKGSFIEICRDPRGKRGMEVPPITNVDPAEPKREGQGAQVP